MGKDVIIACDFSSKEETLAFLDQFSGKKPYVKIGMELFYAEGPEIVRAIKARGHQIFLALKLERDCTKEEILELYVNTIYFGDGYYGIGEAAPGYYGKEPKYLNPYECTMLAGLPNAPSAYALREHPDLAEQRRQIVVGQMEKYGYLSAQEERWLKGALIKGRKASAELDTAAENSCRG